MKKHQIFQTLIFPKFNGWHLPGLFELSLTIFTFFYHLLVQTIKVVPVFWNEVWLIFFNINQAELKTYEASGTGIWKWVFIQWPILITFIVIYIFRIGFFSKYGRLFKIAFIISYLLLIPHILYTRFVWGYY